MLAYTNLCLLYVTLSQSSSSLSSYVQACAYSPANQYGVYGGPAGSYVTGHPWQSQGATLSHPNNATAMHAPNLHSPMAFKHSSREGSCLGKLFSSSQLVLLNDHAIFVLVIQQWELGVVSICVLVIQQSGSEVLSLFN